MSRIFDALQRFEQEKRAGQATNPAAAPDTPAAAVASAAPAYAASATLTQTVAEPDWNPKPLNIAPEESSRLVAISDPFSIGAENFRMLGSRLAQMKTAGRNRILITSSVADEGKTVIATNLAATLAKRSGERVLLIEGDLRAPKVLDDLGAGQAAGISEWYRLGGSIFDYIYRVQSLELNVLPAGLGVDDPLELLDSQAFSRTMTLLAQHFDWIVVDSSPLVPVADSLCWMRNIDSVLLVTRENKTPKNLLAKAVKTIDQSKIIGVVLNDASRAKSASKYYGYYKYGNRGNAASKSPEVTN
ncbi:MAG TPA: CpsD/CapB family tyrosine-protein kinase [Clostridia bacterium]|nr:CpsD/CapB family tyrosine-protein kinase [Clostridia bacterium]